MTGPRPVTVEGEEDDGAEGDGGGGVGGLAAGGVAGVKGSLLNGSAGKLAETVAPHFGQVGSVVVVPQVPQFVGSS